MDELRTLDAVAAAVLALGAFRGLWIGAVREAFSLAGLATAVLVVRAWREPAAHWLDTRGPFEMTELAAGILAALLLGVASLLVVAIVGRVVRRGVRGAGLGLLDRAAGLLLGAAEGAVVVAALVVGLSALLGRDDDALAGTRTLAVLEATEDALGVEAPAVSTGPPSARARE